MHRARAIHGSGLAAIVAAGLLLVAGAGIVSLLGDGFRTAAIESSVEADDSRVQAFARANLRPAELQDPLTDARVSELQAQLRSLLGAGVLRVTVFSADGTVLLSDQPRMRGQNFGLTEPMAQALGGVPDAAIEPAPSAPALPGGSPALEEYLPVVLDGRNVAVVEIYRDAAPILADLARARTLVDVGALIALAICGLALMMWVLSRSRPSGSPVPAARRRALPAS